MYNFAFGALFGGAKLTKAPLWQRDWAERKYLTGLV